MVWILSLKLKGGFPEKKKKDFLSFLDIPFYFSFVWVLDRSLLQRVEQ